MPSTRRGNDRLTEYVTGYLTVWGQCVRHLLGAPCGNRTRGPTMATTTMSTTISSAVVTMAAAMAVAMTVATARAMSLSMVVAISERE